MMQGGCGVDCAFVTMMTYCYRQHPDRNRLYFIVSFIAYIIGLVTTIIVMHTFKAAQVGDN